MTKEQRAYCAGFFDGEGCVGIRKGVRSGTYLKTSVSNTNLSVIEYIHSLFGGRIEIHKRGEKIPHYKTCYILEFRTQEAKKFLEAVKPYCVVKGKQIDVALEYLARPLYNGGHRNRKPVKAILYEFQLADIMKQLKKVA